MSIDQLGSQAGVWFQVFGCNLEAAATSFSAVEMVSEWFRVEVCFSTFIEITSFSELVGKEAALTIFNTKDATETEEDTNRYFHGIIRRIEYTGMKGEYYLYRVELVPTVWRFSLRRNCRIFQETTTHEIVQTLLEEGGIDSQHYRFALANTDRPRGFCVQYRESDLDFIGRLLQEEGIFYFFEHYRDKHIMVFGDHGTVPRPINGGAALTFNHNHGLVAEEASITSFSHGNRLTSNSFVHRNFSFKRPSLDLTFQHSSRDKEDLEVFDYPGPFIDSARGEHLAKVRLEELNATQCLAEGESSSCGITPGHLFTLTNHDVPSLNAEYLIVSATHRGEQSQSLQELGEGAFTYSNCFTAIPSATPFRPPLTIEKPVVQGLQSAFVVGPPNEEIHTDRYGRVKVQFHWDREGGRNERSSCWLRCAQGWGGAARGMVFTPRVGDEVLVDFLEGDPDRPLVVGSVYNERHLPLYDLPANKTVSTIRTKSYPHGSGFNELRFEDRKGSEEIYLHGQRNWTIAIENDKNQSVGHDEVLKVANNREKEVGADQRITIGANHRETVGLTTSVSVGGNKTETVAVNSSESVGLAKELGIGGLYQVTVGGAMNETVAGAKAEEVGISKSVLVGAHMTEKVAGNRSLSVGKNFTVTVTQSHTVKAKSIVFEADDEIVLKSGSSLISMKSNGDIAVSGGTIQTKGSGEVVIKGMRISEN